MSRTRNRGKKSPARPSELDDARNELFSHIHRCGVLQATEEQQVEWMKETVEFLGERYPSLTDAELKSLEDIGLRFCRPVIARGAVSTEPEADVEAAGEQAAA